MTLFGDPSGKLDMAENVREPRFGGPAREARGGHGALGGVPYK
jgi:hypothetical protein